MGAVLEIDLVAHIRPQADGTENPSTPPPGRMAADVFPVVTSLREFWNPAVPLKPVALKLISPTLEGREQTHRSAAVENFGPNNACSVRSLDETNCVVTPLSNVVVKLRSKSYAISASI